LEHCLNVVGVALAALERETATTQVATADAQARIVDEGSLRLVVLSNICNF
jgi:hypothetical protein